MKHKTKSPLADSIGARLKEKRLKRRHETECRAEEGSLDPLGSAAEWRRRYADLSTVHEVFCVGIRKALGITCPVSLSTILEVAIAMAWTREKPTVAGFYWVKNAMGRKDKPEVKEFALDELPHGSGVVEPVYGPYSTEGWDWFAGPLQAPNVVFSCREPDGLSKQQGDTDGKH